MKLINKFLTSLAPVAMVGVITPTLVACGKGNGYSINYGDKVNCLKQELENYHSIKDVKNAIKWKIDQELKRDDIVLADINSDLKTKNYAHYFYYELIASNVFNDTPMSLMDWNTDTANQISFNFNDQGTTTVTATSESPCFTYIAGEGEHDREIYIQISYTSGMTIQNFKSYRFWNCKIGI